VTLDFANHTNARVPFLNRDLGKLRDDIRAKKFLGEYKLDDAHIFIVPEGCRLKRDVVFYQDGELKLAFGHHLSIAAEAAGRCANRVLLRQPESLRQHVASRSAVIRFSMHLRRKASPWRWRIIPWRALQRPRSDAGLCAEDQGGGAHVAVGGARRWD
jgi:hypothetical protein